MTLPIQTLPIVERWDCANCSQCCRGSVIPLDPTDLLRLREQRWDRHPDYEGLRVIECDGLFRARYRLAQRDDGSCVFLTDKGLCRIHEEFGFEAKPLVCRMYPLQLVPLETSALLTLRRSCPSAAADQGRPVSDYREQARAAVRERPALAEAGRPPAILRGQRRSWSDTLIVADGLARLLNDERFPIVRRLAHGLQFCDLLEACRLRRLDTARLRELVGVLEENAPGEASAWFRDRRPPKGIAGVLFRQIVADYLRLHPRFTVRSSWRQRWRMAIVAGGFAVGRGRVPALLPDFPRPRFDELERRELGPLDPALQEPLTRYFATSAESKQYAVISRPGWSLIDRYRALAVAFPVAMWMLRYFCSDGEPAAQDIIGAITTIERGQGFGRLAGSHHRRRIGNLARLAELGPLCAWYAR